MFHLFGGSITVGMSQIQDSSNYLKDASEKLDLIKATQMAVEGDSGKGGVVKRNPTEIRKAFEGLITCLRRAESVLVLPPPTTALQIYNAEQKVPSHGSSHDM